MARKQANTGCPSPRREGNGTAEEKHSRLSNLQPRAELGPPPAPRCPGSLHPRERRCPRAPGGRVTVHLRARVGAAPAHPRPPLPSNTTGGRHSRPAPRAPCPPCTAPRVRLSPPTEPRGRAGKPRAPEPRSLLPAQLGEGLEIELLDLLLAQPVAHSLPLEKGLHLPPRPGSSGPEEMAHRPSLAAGARRERAGTSSRRRGRGARLGARSPAGREGRAGRGGAGRGSGAQRGRPLAAAARARPRRLPRGSPARKFASAAAGRPGGPRGGPARRPAATSGRATRPPAAATEDRPALGLRAAPRPASPAGPPASPLGRRRRPFRAGRAPLPARWDPAGRTRPPAASPRPRSSPAAATPRSSWSSSSRAPSEPGPAAAPAAAALTRPAGPLDPRAEEARPRRPPGGSAARHLLKAPRPPRLGMCLFVPGSGCGAWSRGERGPGFGAPSF